MGADQKCAAAGMVVGSVLALRDLLGVKGFAGRSKFSRRIISVRKVVRTRFLISSGNRMLPVQTRASFMAEAATKLSNSALRVELDSPAAASRRISAQTLSAVDR
jgi:hypothetical protein